MSQSVGRHDDLDPEAVVGPPVTGEASVDDALLGLAELALAPVAEHPDRLAQAHERLHQALDRDHS